ncbi:hypothetical protein [Actinoplanes rectilineatus]|uniref:hypothetical protein n=1 Tax=Actinoplanes rectilineatus TaxID=113571 RepID=UPI0005F287EE|nr:hypothetical protein [Actinoplanes rectilineatus]
MTDVRAWVYEGDSLATHVERLTDTDDNNSYYLLPDPLVTAYETAEKQIAAARTAIEAHIRDNRLQKYDPAWTEIGS